MAFALFILPRVYLCQFCNFIKQLDSLKRAGNPSSRACEASFEIICGGGQELISNMQCLATANASKIPLANQYAPRLVANVDENVVASYQRLVNPRNGVSDFTVERAKRDSLSDRRHFLNLISSCLSIESENTTNIFCVTSTVSSSCSRANFIFGCLGAIPTARSFLISCASKPMFLTQSIRAASAMFKSSSISSSFHDRISSSAHSCLGTNFRRSGLRSSYSYR
jgi:hypothetical protein